MKVLEVKKKVEESEETFNELIKLEVKKMAEESVTPADIVKALYTRFKVEIRREFDTGAQKVEEALREHFKECGSIKRIRVKGMAGKFVGGISSFPSIRSLKTLILNQKECASLDDKLVVMILVASYALSVGSTPPANESRGDSPLFYVSEAMEEWAKILNEIRGRKRNIYSKICMGSLNAHWKPLQVLELVKFIMDPKSDVHVNGNDKSGGLSEVRNSNVSGRIEAFNCLAEGNNFPDVLQSKRGHCGDVPASEITKLMKLGNLESASTHSLFSKDNNDI
ncbi:hypothetical protein OROMI_001236 [Orobanche minor]